MSRYSLLRLILPAALLALVGSLSAVHGQEPSATSETGTGAWDWDSFAPADDGPTVRQNKVIKRDTPDSQQTPDIPRVGETAAPDLEAEAHAAYALFPDAPGFAVIPSVRDRDMHPCGNCHTWTTSDSTPRVLKQPHDNFSLEHGLHGKGGFWCFTCHTLDGGTGALKTLEGQTLDFNEAYVLCSQCHAKEARDWVFGAHGKRVANWQGDRQVYNCTVCHYQHRPAIKPREALPGPQVRQGLARPDHWRPLSEREYKASHARSSWQESMAAEGNAGGGQ